MEQVQRTGSALNSSGFKDIRTFEILLRDFEVGREKEVPALQSLLIAQLQPTQHAAEVRSGKKQKLGGKRAANGGAEASAAELGEPVALVEPIDAAPGDAVVEQGVAGKSSRLSVKPVGTGKGHTGFLTFARKACD